MTNREQLIQTITAEATEWRRELHRNPQTMYEETFASDFIAAKLTAATGAARELTAMEAERTHLAERASALEDEQLEVLEQLEPLEDADAALREQARAAMAARDAAASRVDEERAAATAEVARLEGERPGLTAALDAGLLARYEQAARHTGGVGAARLVDGRCGGCRVTVPAAIADHLLHGEDGLVEVCDECGRLLVR